MIAGTADRQFDRAENEIVRSQRLERIFGASTLLRRNFSILIQVGDRLDHAIGAIGEVFQILSIRSAGENENRLTTHLNTAQDVRFHRVSDDGALIRGEAEFLASGSHHDGTGLAEAECLHTGSCF